MKKTRYFDSFAEYHDFYEENGHEINRVDVVAGPLWIVADAEIECRGWRTALRRFESAISEDEQFSWTVGYYADAKRVDDVDGRFYNDCDGYMIEQLSDGLWYVAARTAVKTAEDDETETGDEIAEETSEDQSSEDQSEEETGEDAETVGISLSDLRDALDSGEISREEYRQACREMREDLDGMERVYNATRDRSVSESVAEIVRDYNDRFYGRYGFRGSMEGAADAVRDMVASLVNRSAWDGRLSRRVVAWAASREYAVSADLAVEMGIQTGIHLANLNQIAQCLMDYTPEERTDEEERTGAPASSPSETVAESLVLPTDSDRVRAICERIGERIAEYATMPVDSLDVCIADGNEKVGHIKNVSQPPVISCRGVCAECGGDCYDGRAVLQYPDTAAARGRNWSIYCRDPLAYFGQIIGTVRRMRKRFFRWHVGGEIVDGLYFRLMIATARLAPRVTFLCFTKRHKLIADELSAMGGRDALPENLRLILSAWPGLPLYNPYNLPVSAPYSGDKPRTWYGCPGNCEDCAARNIGCWSLPSGAVVGFAYHGTAGDLFAERFAAWEDRPAGRRARRTASSKKGAATA